MLCVCLANLFCPPAHVPTSAQAALPPSQAWEAVVGHNSALDLTRPDALTATFQVQCLDT